MGATVIMICRDRKRGEAAQKHIVEESGNDAVDLIIADLSSIKSIREGSAFLKSRYQQLHVLVNNAGVVMMERIESVDGFELSFAVNFMGYFVLTYELLDLLKASSPARIVNVAAPAQYFHALELNDLQWEKRPYNGFRVYLTTKFLEIIFTVELARRLSSSGVIANCLHPGGVRTNIARNWPTWAKPIVQIVNQFMASPEKGARTSLYLATSPEVTDVSGCYFVNKRRKRLNAAARDPILAAQLWDRSEKLFGIR